MGNWDAIVSKADGAADSPHDTRTHNTVNEITALDPQGPVVGSGLTVGDLEGRGYWVG